VKRAPNPSSPARTIEGTRIVRLFLLLITLGPIIGCSYNMAQWEGKTTTELTNKWGQPLEERILPDGGKRVVITYVASNNYSPSTCYMFFDTDSTNTITSWFSIGC